MYWKKKEFRHSCAKEHFYQLATLDLHCIFFNPAFIAIWLQSIIFSSGWGVFTSLVPFFSCSVTRVPWACSPIPHAEQPLCPYQPPTAREALSVPLSFATNMRFTFPLMAISLEVVMIVLFALFVQYDTGSNNSEVNSTESPAIDVETSMDLYPRE